MINEFSGKYRFLSNFWSCFIQFGGMTFPSVENAYQACKMKHASDRERFLYIKASQAKKLGKLLPMADTWDQNRIQIMYHLVEAKFRDPILAGLLLETGDEELQEGNWWGDFFWGTVNGVGENHLGKILMEVRENLRKGRP
jgi:ribA/ribD-fused uncharacterized protein